MSSNTRENYAQVNSLQ